MTEREDFPHCPFCLPGQKETVDVRRVLFKLDELYGRNDLDGARRLVDYWLGEAERMGDRRAKLSLLNEAVGIARKTQNEEAGLEFVRQALAVSAEFPNSLTWATTRLNAATAYKAFDRANEALPLYEEALAVYEGELAPEDERLAGLYNNMALTLTALSEFDRAEAMYQKALTITEGADRAAENAITCCNLADLVSARDGSETAEEAVNGWLEQAWKKLESVKERGGNYAYACEKCASVFGYYGYFLREKELTARARKLYEGT